MNAGKVCVRSKLSNMWVGALVVCVGVLVASRGGAEVLSGRLYPTDPVPGNQNRADLTLEAETNGCTPQVDCPSDTQTSHVLAERPPDQSHVDLSYDTDSSQATLTDFVLIGEDIHFFLNVVIQPRVEEIRVSLDPSLPGPTASVDPITGAFTVSADVLVHGIIRMSASGTPYPFDDTANLVLEGNLTFSKIGAGEGAFLIENGGASLSPMWQTFFGITFWISGEVYLEMQTETPPDQACNGSFENGGTTPAMPDCWLSNRNFTVGGGRVSQTAHTGSWSVRMMGDGTSKLLVQDITRAGRGGLSHTLSLWGRARDASRAAAYRAVVTAYYEDGTKGQWQVSLLPGSSAWHQYQVVATPDRSYTRIRITIQYRDANGGKVWFDDVSYR